MNCISSVGFVHFVLVIMWRLCCLFRTRRRTWCVGPSRRSSEADSSRHRQWSRITKRFVCCGHVYVALVSFTHKFSKAVNIWRLLLSWPCKICYSVVFIFQIRLIQHCHSSVYCCRWLDNRKGSPVCLKYCTGWPLGLESHGKSWNLGRPYSGPG